jgi:drug/metabolite transporter (DMT)-like permease
MRALRFKLALVVSNLLFGASFSVYVSLLHDGVSPEQLFAMQLLFSLSIFTPLALTQRSFFRLSLNDFGSIFIVALLVVFGWWYLLIEGASYTNPIDASTIAVIGPIFTLWTSIIAHSRRPTKGEMFGFALALLGVMAIIADRGISLVGSGSEGYGNALVFCAVVAISINTVLITPVLRRRGTVVVMGWYYLVGTLLAMPLIVDCLPKVNMSELAHLHKAEVCYILVFGSALPMYLLYKSSEHLTAIHNALYHYIQPIIAALFAILRGQAKIDRTNIIGAVLIFVGMLCVVLSTPRNEVAIRE